MVALKLTPWVKVLLEVVCKIMVHLKIEKESRGNSHRIPVYPVHRDSSLKLPLSVRLCNSPLFREEYIG
jgi:hypothetical protein